MAFNKKILEQVRASQTQNNNLQSSSNSGDWKQYLTSEQLIAQQNLENRVDDENLNFYDKEVYDDVLEYMQSAFLNVDISI